MNILYIIYYNNILLLFDTLNAALKSRIQPALFLLELQGLAVRDSQTGTVKNAPKRRD